MSTVQPTAPRPTAQPVLDPGASAQRQPGPARSFPEVDLRALAFAITGIFEGGRADSLQTLDDGIISYGAHQATLRSGALGLVLEEYLSRSTSETAMRLAEYSVLVAERDPALAEDPVFLSLLRNAAEDPEMAEAQDQVFGASYWTPAYNKALASGLTSPIGYALFYDTAIQGGLAAILRRTELDVGAGPRDEALFLGTFLENRREYLLEVAEAKRLDGKLTQANMLERSAELRVGFFESWLAQELAGG